jgi:LacI family transcriptional regulator
VSDARRRGLIRDSGIGIEIIEQLLFHELKEAHQLVTMKDIAKQVGVSQATVSRVINGKISVDPEIRMRVMECVRKLNYQPNAMAKSLAGNKSRLIGVIVTDISNPFFSDVIKIIESEATRYGYSIILCNTDYDIEKEKKYMSILNSYNVDGILVVPINSKDKYFRSLNNRVPLVVITQEVMNYSCIYISHYIGGKEVAKHLINMGYSKFVFIGDIDDDKYRGYKDQIESEGINLSNSLMFIDKDRFKADNTELIEFINNNIQTHRIGIFAFNDVQALVIYHLLKVMKVQVPEKVGLVGFDNTFISEEVSPTLSSVTQPIEEIGRQSVQMLIDQIYDNESTEKKHVILKTRLIARESSVKALVIPKNII